MTCVHYFQTPSFTRMLVDASSIYLFDMRREIDYLCHEMRQGPLLSYPEFSRDRLFAVPPRLMSWSLLITCSVFALFVKRITKESTTDVNKEVLY